MPARANRTNRLTQGSTTGALLLMAAVGLAACQTGSVESGRQVARSTLQVDESIAAFSDLCLAEGFTKDDITRVAEKYDLGISEPADLKRGGQPEIVVRGVVDPATGRYGTYGCAVAFQGAWSDEIVADVARTIAARGFKAKAPFKREAGRSIYPPVNTINHNSVYTRAGKPYAITINSNLGGSDSTHRYIAHTILLVLAP